MGKKHDVDIGYVFIIILFIVYFLVFEIINIFYVRYGIGADEAQTGICSKIFWEAKSLHPSDFFAWTESGAFSLATIGAIIYGLTGSMLAAQGVSPAIITVLILLAIYRLFKYIGISKKGIALGLLSILCIPLGFMSQMISFLSYAAYSVCVLTMFLVLTDYIQLVSGDLKHKRITIIFHVLLAVANGCNSSRGVLVVYMPLFILACTRYLLKAIHAKKVYEKKEARAVVFTFALTALSYLSTYLPYSSRTSVSKAFRRSPVKLVTEVMPMLNNWIGINKTSNIYLISMLILIIIMAIGVAVYILYKRGIDDRHQLVIAYLWCDLLLTIVMLSITQTDVTERYFFMSYFILTFSIVFAFEKLRDKSKFVTNIGIGCILIYACLNLIIFYVPILNNSTDDPEYDAISNFMLDNGYFYGYSDYMNANRLTVYADGDVQISAVHIEDLSIWRWTTDVSWYRPCLPEDMKTAYVIPKADINAFSKVLKKHPDIKEGYETDNYMIYVSDKNYSSVD